MKKNLETNEIFINRIKFSKNKLSELENLMNKLLEEKPELTKEDIEGSNQTEKGKNWCRLFNRSRGIVF